MRASRDDVFDAMSTCLLSSSAFFCRFWFENEQIGIYWLVRCSRARALNRLIIVRCRNTLSTVIASDLCCVTRAGRGWQADMQPLMHTWWKVNLVQFERTALIAIRIIHALRWLRFNEFDTIYFSFCLQLVFLNILYCTKSNFSADTQFPSTRQQTAQTLCVHSFFVFSARLL